MAPRTTRQRGADGAKPGAAEPSDKHAFDADQRAKEREGAPVTIGEQVLHRRRKNWAVTRELRGLLRKQERASTRQERIVKQLDELAPDEPDSKSETLEDELDAITDESDEAAYEIIALLLQGEDGLRPTMELLKESLDVEDAGDLAANLSGGGEPDPTPPIPSSSSS